MAIEQIGYYEVPREDGKIINYESKIVYEGDSLHDATEFTVYFPETLVGVKNKFVIHKIGDKKWEGDRDLVDKVRCDKDLAFDFICELKFNEDAVIDVTADDGIVTIENLDSKTLLIDRNLTRTALSLSDLSPMAINAHMVSTDIFASEPIGFLKYRYY